MKFTPPTITEHCTGFPRDVPCLNTLISCVQKIFFSAYFRQYSSHQTWMILGDLSETKKKKTVRFKKHQTN